jgi:hypothetical protein
MRSIRDLDLALGLQEFDDPKCLDIGHMKVVRLSALSTGRLYTPGDSPGTHFR